MRQLLTLTFLFFLCVKCFAQSQSVFNSRDLTITWEPTKNNYKNDGHSLNRLTILNTGRTEFPATGWKLYFNSGHNIDTNTFEGGAKINFINGDLFCLTPGASFVPIKSGESERIVFSEEDPIVNITDGPNGFYLVWDNHPERGYNTGTFITRYGTPVYTGLITPAVIYDQNKDIRDLPFKQLVKIFPTPLSYKETEGVLDINRISRISLAPFDKRFEKEAVELKRFLVSIIGDRNEIYTQTYATKTVKIVVDDNLGLEAYKLSVTPDGVTITAATSTGAFYGLQSFKTLCPPSAFGTPQKEVIIPCVEIKDEPRFAYRSFMLDVARNFEPKHEIYKILDVMALYKLNIFHFHLTDDEGWRLEIPALPELTKIGGRRGHTLDSKSFLPPSHGSGGETDNASGTGFYTRADFIDILKYADYLHIQVVPEIEGPGHARAAIKSMLARYNRLMAEGQKDEAEKYLLNDPNDKSVYSSAQYWNDNVIDVSLPSTYSFVETVASEIVNMYKEAGVPLKTINWGGDEVPAHVWENSPAFATIKLTHPEIQTTSDLWYYFYRNVNQILQLKGIYLSGWEEMALRRTKLDGKPYYLPNPDFVGSHFQADVWNNTLGDGNEDLAYRLANAGYKVVLTNVTNLYFDMASYKAFDEPGYYWGAFVDIDKPFSFIPYDYYKNSKVDKNGQPINPNIFIGKQRLTDYGKGNIAGLQCAVWGETITSTKILEYMLLPRLLGFAERAWSKDPDWATEPNQAKSDSLYKLAWSGFVNVLGKRELPRLSYFDGGFNYRVPKPGVIFKDGKFWVNDQFPGLTIRYSTTTDDPEPVSNLYTEPVSTYFNNIKFRAFDNKGRSSNVSDAAKQ
jgi:hexosaminidase